MADLSITAANVIPGTGAVIDKGKKAGGTVTAGMPVYLDSNNKWQAADADDATQAAASGIALNSAEDDQPLHVQTSGQIQLATSSLMTLGVVYVVSTTAGGIAPDTDLGTGDFLTVVGVSLADETTMVLCFGASGAAHP